MSFAPSSPPNSAPVGDPPKVSHASLLKAQRPPITRYRPAVVGAALFLVLLLVGVGFLVAFAGGHHLKKTAEAAASDRSDPPPAPDFGKGAPTSYADPAARAAPPGTLSLAQTMGPSATEGAAAATPAVSAEAKQALDQVKAAHEAGAFFGAPVSAAAMSAALAPAPLVLAALPATSPAEPKNETSSPSPALSPKQAFVAGAKVKEDYVAAPELAPRSAFEVKAGTIIPAALITGLNSDLPGEVVAQVTENVFDHITGKTALIPQGARLIGQYDSQASYGQNRVLLVWNRLIFPDGRSINIGTMTGVDGTGASGLADRVDTHLPLLLRAVGLSTLITVGGAIAENASARSSSNLVLQDGAGGVSQGASQIGQRFIDRDLGRQPTLMVRPGFKVSVLVSRDMVLDPYFPGIAP